MREMRLMMKTRDTRQLARGDTQSDRCQDDASSAAVGKQNRSMIRVLLFLVSKGSFTFPFIIDMVFTDNYQQFIRQFVD